MSFDLDKVFKRPTKEERMSLPITTKDYIHALEETVKYWQPDIARMQWLSAQTVEVWTPLPAGAQRNFMAAGDVDTPSDLRAQIDARLPTSSQDQGEKK